MKNRIATFLLVTACFLTTFAQKSYTSMDKTSPIEFHGSYITYQGNKIQLNKQAFFIDGQLSDEEADKYPYVFNSVQKAVACATNGTQTTPMTLHIAPYVYWIDNPDDPAVRMPQPGSVPFGMEIDCQWITLNGLTQKAENVVLASNRGQTQGAVGNFTMFHFKGEGVRLNNLTLGNYCNIDLIYPLHPSMNRAKRMSAITQAQLAYCRGDHNEAHNVRFVSRLNLCPLNGGKRTLFDRCYFESTDDALCGTGVYLNCELSFYGSKPFYTTSETGAIFLNCDFNVKEAKRQYLTKAEGLVTLVDCRFHSTEPVFVGWTQDPTGNKICYQANVSLNGKPVLMDADKPWLTVDMTGKPLLDAYRFSYQGKTYYNTYNLLSGDDDWDPMQVKTTVKEAERALKRSLTNLATCLLPQTSEVHIETGARNAQLSVVAKRFGGYAATIEALAWAEQSAANPLVSLKDQTNHSCEAIAANEQEETQSTTIVATTAAGLKAARVIEIAPRFIDAPRFISQPQLKRTAAGRLRVDYTLDLGGRKDQSLITWYRCTDAQGSQALPIVVSRLNQPEYEYELTQNDVGYYILAKVAPKHVRCHAGEEQAVVLPTIIGKQDVVHKSSFYINFQNFPTDYQPRIVPGCWTVDGYKPIDTADFNWTPNPTQHWYYGTGFDAAVGTGLMQANKGARLLYTPTEGAYGDMAVALTVDPCKAAGQGFGSATGQYMDIYIKLDTHTLTGYALRIIRTTKYHNAVDFVLMRYTNGVATAISQPVSSTCYRTDCHITLQAKAGKLTAHAQTSSPQPATNDANLHTEVDLQADIVPTAFGGSGIQHTGSNGPSATMLHEMSIEY